MSRAFTALAAALVLSCTDDFNRFSIDPGGGNDGAPQTDAPPPGAGGSSGGSGGRAAGGSGAGMTTGGGGGMEGGLVDGSAGGAPDAATGGTGGAPDAATGGTGGAPDAATGGTGGSCLTNEKDCSGECVLISDPAFGCAAAECTPCAFPNATAACVAGACGIGACLPGWGACNPDLADGCEQPTDTNLEHCGSCNRACSTANVVSAECSGGRCNSSCAPGWANCNQPASGSDNGCEVNATNNSGNCGGCGNNCNAQGDASGFSCVASVCACTNRNQCGSGGNVQCTSGSCVCSGTTCRPGEPCRAVGPDQVCLCNDGPSCGASEVCCHTPAGCRDLSTASDSCGSCGRACTPGFVCSGGRCQCDADADCNAGSAGTCSVGLCTCGTTNCAEGQRCLAGGSCG